MKTALKLMGEENSLDNEEDRKYCRCERITGTYTVVEEFGYQDMCSVCELPIEEGFHYYNHYDGEDHIDCEW